MLETLISSETFVLTRATWPNIPEEGILHSHDCENLRSYIIRFVGWYTVDMSSESVNSYDMSVN
jgi:hypothetical protein